MDVGEVGSVKLGEGAPTIGAVDWLQGRADFGSACIAGHCFLGSLGVLFPSRFFRA